MNAAAENQADSPQASEQLTSATALYRAGQFDQAASCLREVVQHSPDNAQAWYLLGCIASRMQEYPAAIGHLTKAIELDPGNLDAHMRLGSTYYAAQRPQEAIASYEALIRLQPEFALAYSNLGACYVAQKDVANAQRCFRKAIELQPNFVNAYNNLGTLYQELGQMGDAIECFRRAIELQPRSPAAYHHLGCAYAQAKQAAEAIQYLNEAIALRPDYASAYYNLGCVYNSQHDLANAVRCFRKVIEIDPTYVLAYSNLGCIYREQHDPDLARACFERALKIQPDSVAAHNNLGLLLQEHGKHVEAEEHFLRAIELKADFAEAWGNLGLNYHWRGKLSQAIECVTKALQLQPDYAQAHNNLGNTYAYQGKPAQAIQCYEQSLRIKPDYEDAVHNILMCLHYDEGSEPADIYAQHVRYTRAYLGTCPAVTKQSHDQRNRDPERRIRIGYVSGDFKRHSVSYFIEPILTFHDRNSTDVICYANNEYSDATKERLKSLAGGWREVARLTGDELAGMITADQVDILVDLSGHTGASRVFLFARQLAPIQVTYLGYPNTTGLSEVQYRLTDELADPRGEADGRHSEALVRLPHGFLCYRPPDVAPPVALPPVLDKGHVTFGCFNNPAKLSHGVFECWGAMMRRMPEARLILKGEAFGDRGTRDHVLGVMQQCGIELERVELLSWIEGLGAHLGAYQQVDIALDTFPYTGTTTTCEALWMGVPVITLAGRAHVSRVGASLLTSVGLTELIAHSADEYAEKAVDLAHHVDRLRQLRAELRDRMKSAPLTNGPLITRTIEDAYRWMWRRWCMS